MNQLQIIGQQYIAGYRFTGIEGGFGEEKKAMLVKDIAVIHGQALKEVNRRINDNRKRFKDGVDIIDLKVSGFEPLSFTDLGFSRQSVANSNNIYLLSERGYAKLLKILEDDKAWELYDILVDEYFNMRKQQIDTTQLSPELQMFQTLFTTLATQELNQKKLEQKVDNISEIVALNSTDWRKDTTLILNKIARKQGGFEMYRKIRNESYEILEQRASAKLSIRVNNKKKIMALEGVSKSKIDKVSNLDIIGEDKRLLEIYLAIVKEMAIRYQVNINEAI
ncbi:ORF6N domain-containing protein [Bacillus cereus group sp. TH43LC]|uniref:ORF6N domain-containing protein n=1 Tax=Bacillus cereus group TaxID=86661 RepID=UPI001E457BE8|nr:MULTISPECIES: ORF6N domain-containing protein [Bacillus cereus group]MCC2443223.1 ORF6N domain-containing protein [Bacillus cereus]MCU5425759.1 ORF6N domain-containing protein [Bacillus tropicus]MCU5617004.1 ORF6N domain-containing protein [Bacillus cereus]MDA1504876.1 ORF6N domain-containing protein [Bacillus cereus group sp. TH43LC]MDA1862726.1 ORF6N domain-containing protein [Bacillus cereus group sp. BY128LC]